MANKYNKNSIKNADTRARREWIESALESVRAHLDVATFQPSTLESLGHEPQRLKSSNPEFLTERCTVPRSGLYLIWSDGERRSGT